eukprot:CAMPEP_0184499236 /NCGR_PEP_ID=MMETSP0113_2-20130426/40936_1 /TAXON_ID=91329 /ORGANISM="Norrisiella sphaerica, Strain BC52" /LENGTH=421 /DNA_ID=CAMNT_0026887071 /DNA_START=242 /DNA_END=1507 /DNA_ORIENTATION=+
MAILILCSLSLVFTFFGQFMKAFSVEYSLNVSIPPFLKYSKKGRTFEFNMWKGAAELAKVDMQWLSILVYIWSGFWPYLKLLFIVLHVCLEESCPNTFPCLRSMVAMCIPVVQYLGKWAFLDVCVVMIIGVVLHVDKSVGIADFSIQTIVLEGQFVFMLGVALCLVAQTLTSRPVRPRIYSSIETPFGSHNPILNALADAEEEHNVADDEMILTKDYMGIGKKKSFSEYVISGIQALWPPILLLTALLAQSIGNLTAFLTVRASFDPITVIEDRAYSIVEGFNDMTQTIHNAGRLNIGHAIFGYLFVSLMPIFSDMLMLTAWLLPGPSRSREKALHWACICREWCLMDVYWLASIVSMFELPEISNYIANEFNDVRKFGKLEIAMYPRHTLYWLPIVLLVENLAFFHMKSRLESKPCSNHI